MRRGNGENAEKPLCQKSDIQGDLIDFLKTTDDLLLKKSFFALITSERCSFLSNLQITKKISRSKEIKLKVIILAWIKRRIE